MKRSISILFAIMATTIITFAEQKTINCGDQVKVTATPAEGVVSNGKVYQIVL